MSHLSTKFQDNPNPEGGGRPDDSDELEVPKMEDDEWGRGGSLARASRFVIWYCLTHPLLMLLVGWFDVSKINKMLLGSLGI